MFFFSNPRIKSRNYLPSRSLPPQHCCAAQGIDPEPNGDYSHFLLSGEDVALPKNFLVLPRKDL